MTSVETNQWVVTREALIEAVCAASGFDPEHVLWAAQNINQPSGAYIDLAITSSVNPGIDGVGSSTDLSRPEGQEVKLQVVGTREAVLQIEVYTNPAVETRDEGASALAVVERMRSAFVLPGIPDRLARFKVSFLDIEGDATYAPTIVRAGFRGHAIWDVRLSLDAVALFQYTGYIAQVGGTVVAHGTNPDPLIVPFASP